MPEKIPEKVPEKRIFSEKKGAKPLYVVMAVMLVAIAVLLYFVFRSKGAGQKGTGQMKQMAETVQKIQSIESEIQEKQNDVFNLMAEYKKKTGKPLTETNLNMLNLTEGQKQVLEEKIKQEQNVSIKSLLQDILDRNTEITGLQGKIQELEAMLPTPHVVDKGENHYEIAVAFLVNDKGLDKNKALELIERAALFEPLIPGFKVWNFYGQDEYGTFVTQGTAAISPNQVQRKVKKELVDAKNQAIAEKEKLATDIQELEQRRSELISQVELINQEKQEQLTRIEGLNTQNQDMERQLNSLFYIVDMKRNLQKNGILKGGFLRSTKLNPIPAENFTDSIDLRKETSITISAATLGISKVKDVSLFPKYYKLGVDYTLAYDEDRQTATLTILDIKKLKNEKVVIAVE